MANIVNVTVDDTTETVNLSVSDGIITAAGGGTFIGGFLVTKGAGNVAATIEIGDKVLGWIGNSIVAGVSLINGTPSSVSDVTPAINNEAL